MDFHSLSRKDLQGLCKKNKIPANTTNVAMAETLSALEMVEGLDEVLNQPMSEPQQSPPRTSCRSSRRKPVLIEPFSSQTLTRTRRASRTVADNAEQETKNEPTEGADQEDVGDNLLQTPAVPSGRGRGRGRAVSVRKKTEVPLVESKEEEKKNLLENPAVKGSSRRIAETKNAEKSAVMVYSTRRSVRLLEQTMEVLSLKENENTEVEVKKDACGIDSDAELCHNLAKSLDEASGMNPEHAEVSGLEAGEVSMEKSSLPEEQVSEEVPKGQELGEETKGIESESADASHQLDATLHVVAHESIDQTKVEEECRANEMHQVQEDGSDYKKSLVDVSIVEDDNFTIPCFRKTPAPANQVSLSCPSGDAEKQTLSDVYVALAAEFIVASIPASPMEKLHLAKCNSSPYQPFPGDTIEGQFPHPLGSATRNPFVKKQNKSEMADDIVDTVIDKENITEELIEEEKVEFNNMSLRQLKKMFRDMTIAKRNTDEENDIKVENNNTRMALQVLPDN